MGVTTPKRRDQKLQEKADASLQDSLLKSLGAGFTNFVATRKKSLDLDHQEKVRESLIVCFEAVFIVARDQIL